MIISLIVAMGRNHVIGNKNALPWKLPADMRRFREVTIGKPVIMGRVTFESIGKPLPNRLNIIMTRDPHYRAEGCMVAHSVDEALQTAGNVPEVMIIGGGVIFEEFLSQAKRIYLTIIDQDFEGDVLFPEFNRDEWKETERKEFKPDEKNKYRYTFLTLEK